MSLTPDAAPPSPRFPLRIYGLAGSVCEVQADPEWLAVDLREQIQLATGVVPDAQRLFLGTTEFGLAELMDADRLGALLQPGPTELTLIKRSPEQVEWLQRVRENSSTFKTAPAEVRADVGIALLAVSNDWRRIEDVSSDLRWDARLVRRALSAGGPVARCATAEQRADKLIMLEAVRRDGMNLKHVAEPLKSDRDIVWAAVGRSATALEHAAESFAEDVDLLVFAVTRDGCMLEFASPQLQADRDLVMAAVSQDGQALEFASAELQADRDIVRAAVKKDGCALAYAATSACEDAELVMCAIQRHGLALEFACEALQASREHVAMAVENDCRSLLFASRELRSDPALVAASLHRASRGYNRESDQPEDRAQLRVQVARCVPEELWSDRPFVTELVMAEGRALEYAAMPLRSDCEIVSAALRQCQGALEFASADLKDQLGDSGATAWPQ